MPRRARSGTITEWIRDVSSFGSTSPSTVPRSPGRWQQRASIDRSPGASDSSQPSRRRWGRPTSRLPSEPGLPGRSLGRADEAGVVAAEDEGADRAAGFVGWKTDQALFEVAGD